MNGGSRIDADAIRPRPSLPLVLYCAAGIWLGCYFGFVFREAFGGVALLGLSAALVLSCAVAGVALHRRGLPFAVPCGAIGFAVFGLLLTFSQGLYLDNMRTAGIDMSGETAVVRILEDPSVGQYGETVLAEIHFPDSGIQSRGLPMILEPKIKVRIRLSDDVSYGEEFCARVVLSEPSETVKSYYDRNGIALVCRIYDKEPIAASSLGVLTHVRNEFAQHVTDLATLYGFEEESLALINALVVGDRTDLEDTTLYQDVRATGLAHLVAVSGAHLVIVLGLTQVVLTALHVPRRTSVILQCSFLGVYLVMVGFPISCIRAACMSCATLLAFAARKRSNALSSLSVVIIVLIALDPTTATSVSFALSALATLGIVVFMPLFSHWFSSTSTSFRAMFVDPIAMTFAALLLTFPVSIACFSQFPFIAPLSNLVAGPFVTAMCGLGTLAFILLPLPPVCDALLFVVNVIACCFGYVLDILVAVPGINAPMYVPIPLLVMLSAAIAVTLWVTWPKHFPLRLVGAGLTVCILVCVVSTALRIEADEIVMLDVGQGDAFLLRSNGVTMLVDTGNQTSSLLSALARQGVAHIDALLVTHADDDHCGCIPDLRGIVSCDKVIVASGMSEEDDASAQELIENAQTYVGSENVIEVERGDELEVGAFELEVISPSSLTDDGGNADSICFLLESDLDGNGEEEWSALFCGDAESEVLQKLVDDKLLGQVDIFKVGHHGALASLTEELAQTLHPKLSLISVGENNTYGHPRQEVITMLEQQGSHVFRTDEQGDVACILSVSGIEVRTLR